MSPSSTSSAAHPKINKLFHRNSRQNADHPPSSFTSSQDPSSSSTTSNPPTLIRRLSRRSSKPQVVEIPPPPPPEDIQSPEDVSLMETPIIVEPPPIPIPEYRQPVPRAGRRSVTIDRPLTMTFPTYDASFAQSSPTTARLSDISSRLSGWFSHSFSSSSTDLPLPSSDSLGASATNQQAGSTSPPKQKAAAGILARNPTKGIGGPFEKAVRYFFDSDAQPDKCTDPIWLMGVQHPGYEPPSPGHHGHRRDSTEVTTRRSTPPTISKGSAGYHKNPSLQSLSLSLTLSSSNQTNGKQPLSWPPEFYDDFTSCIWMTYRSQYIPLRDITLAALEASAEVDPVALPQSVSSPPRKWWGGERSWTSDAGWGCMLRTGQSLLATALVHLHLGRDWRRPLGPTLTPEYANYVKIISWFLDSTSTLCPFGVHRMALAGKELGTDVGSWFGPSVAAGAIKRLAHAYPDAGLSISVASNNEVFESDIYAASHIIAPDSNLGASKRSKWGGRAVLVLIGIRLGIDGVTPVYYDGLKEIFTWPQSVGISGGRPSSSYYFVGHQAGSLFYLDPHHTRPTIPLRTPNLPVTIPSSPATTTNSHLEGGDSADDRPVTASPGHARRPTTASSRHSTPDREFEPANFSFTGRMRSGSIKLKHKRNTGSPTGGSGSSNASLSMHAPLSPSPLSQGKQHVHGSPGTSPSRSSFASLIPSNVDPVTYHYATAYSPSELKTFHCDKVRKMPLSAMDPSMLLGFLCKDENDWVDLRSRANEFARTHKPIFTIQDEPPSWSDPDDLESFSDPEPEMDDLDGDGGDRASEDFFDAEDRPVSETSGPEWRARQPSVATSTDESFEFDDEDFQKPEDVVTTARPEPKRSSTLTNSTVSKATDNEDSDDDDDWGSSVPSSSSPPTFSKALEGPQPIPASGEEASPRHSQSSSRHSHSSASASSYGSTQYPFPRVPSPQTQDPTRARAINPGMRSLTAKDGGRTPSGGVLAIFNPQQD